MSKRPHITYLKKNFDSLALVTVLGHLAFQADVSDLDEDDLAALAALKRAVPGLDGASLDDIQSYLRSMDEGQLVGLTSNVKGVLHEMEYVRIENEDGDSVYATYFDSASHPGTDIQLVDRDTGEIWEFQLKATDSSSYVQEWIDRHPDGEILVTQELADRLDLETSGFSNDELTADVDQLVDKIIAEPDTSSIWDFFPALTLASISVIIWQLWGRCRRSEITQDQFKRLAARTTGLKLAKLGLLVSLLSIPVVGQVTGAILVAKLLVSARQMWFANAASRPAWRVIPQNPRLLPE